MDVYSTEEQQVEVIKKFWKEYGVSIIVGVVLALSGLFGWRFYQQHTLSQQEQASADFENLLQQSNSDKEVFTQLVERFNAEHPGSGYDPLARLLLARTLVEANDFAGAEKVLSEAHKELDDTIQPLVQLRLARVQMAQQKYDLAIATLDTIEAGAYLALREETKGDLLLAMGDIEGAKSAYEAAINAMGDRIDPIVQMKLDDLA